MGFKTMKRPMKPTARGIAVLEEVAKSQLALDHAATVAVRSGYLRRLIFRVSRSPAD